MKLVLVPLFPKAQIIPLPLVFLLYSENSMKLSSFYFGFFCCSFLFPPLDCELLRCKTHVCCLLFIGLVDFSGLGLGLL